MKGRIADNVVCVICNLKLPKHQAERVGLGRGGTVRAWAHTRCTEDPDAALAARRAKQAGPPRSARSPR